MMYSIQFHMTCYLSNWDHRYWDWNRILNRSRGSWFDYCYAIGHQGKVEHERGFMGKSLPKPGKGGDAE